MNIEERLTNLEKQLVSIKRRNHWLMGAFILVVSGLFIFSVFETISLVAKEQKESIQIDANEIFLRDSQGRVRAYLSGGHGQANYPVLSLYDELGKARIGLRIDGPAGNPELAIMNEDEERCAILGINKGGATLLIGEPKTDNYAVLSIIKTDDHRDGPRLQFFRDKKTIIDLGTTEKVSAMVFNDRFGTRRSVHLISEEDSVSILFGPDGNILWSSIK